MKFRKIYSAVAVLVGMVLAFSCQSNEVLDPNFGEQIPISFSGDINQLSVTRASDNGFASGDQVGIWAVNYDGDTPGTLELKGNQATNVRFTYNGSTWASDYDIYYKDKNTKVDIYGMYPYSSAISSIEALPFEVREDQSTVSSHGAMGGYEASDFLWAKRPAVTPTPSAVQLLFQHMMSCVVVTLVEGTGFNPGEFAGLSQSVLINNVKRNATINLATGAVTATGGISARSTVPAAYESGFRAIVVPQTVSSSNSLFSITLGGVAYTYSEGAAFTYVAGKQHNFAVTINKKPDGGYEVTVNTTISAWTNDNASHDFTAKEYVVVNVETPGTLGTTITTVGKNPEAIKNLKVLGTINAADFLYMRDNMTQLRGVNLQETKVEEGSIPGEAFQEKTLLSSFIFPDGKHDNVITSIGPFAFYGTNLSGALIIPEGVTTIEGHAFEGTQVTSLSLPNTLTIIDDSAFSLCQLLGGPLELPEGLIKIGSHAFWGCVFTGSLTLPTNLEILGGGAFMQCSYFTGKLVIPPKIVMIGESTFEHDSGFSSISLPDGILSIGQLAFWNAHLKGELHLPSNLQVIERYAFAGNDFSGTLVLPSSLVSLGEMAFQGCSRLSGVLEIPESLYALNQTVFEGCSNLEGIVFPSTLTSIGANAFNGCTSIASIVCYAEQPPVIVSTNAFNGVPKDNFSIEVPEASINEYTYSTGWNEFNRITAHRELSISRRLYRTLNASESRTFVLHAESGAAWSIESKPDWVTVSPSSGTGKTDVTVTVSTLPGSENREGNVVFLLDGKDYRSTLKVEQYNYAYADGTVLTEQTHSTGNGIPIVFMGDCYDAADIASGAYLTDTREAIEHYFDIEPYKTYQNYFDIYIVFGKSEDSGVGTVNTIREAKFGTQYSLTGGSLENDGTEAFNYAKKIDANLDLTKALIVMVLNSSDYGGVTYMWADGSAIAICPKSTDPYPYDFRGLVQHEAGGHGFGKLADEYIYTNAFIQTCLCPNPHLDEFFAGKANGWYKNLSETSDRDAVPWSHLIYNPTYSNIVDIYEGGYFHTRGIFRSEQNSCMNNNIPYYSAISRQAIVERIIDYSGGTFNLEDFYAHDVLTPGTKAAFDAAPSWMPAPSSTTYQKHNHPVIMGDHPETK